VRRASTLAEQFDLPVFDHVSANAPGRIEGSREHTDLAVTRKRDDRHGGSPRGRRARRRRGGFRHTATQQRRGPRRRRHPHGRSTPRSRQTREPPRSQLRRGADHSHHASGLSPRTCRALRPHLDDRHARPSLSSASLDPAVSGLVADREQAGTSPRLCREDSSRRLRITLRSSPRRSMPCPGPREVTSTVAEHETVAARDHVSTNAPSRIDGSRSTRTSSASLDPAVLRRAAQDGIHPVVGFLENGSRGA
jgi:hypothetical protein